MPQVAMTLHGAPYSVYTRIIRLVLAEKALTYHLDQVDIFGADRTRLCIVRGTRSIASPS